MIRVSQEGSSCSGRFQGALSEFFTVASGVKQVDTLAPALFNMALEAALRDLVEHMGVAVGRAVPQAAEDLDDPNAPDIAAAPGPREARVRDGPHLLDLLLPLLLAYADDLVVVAPVPLVVQVPLRCLGHWGHRDLWGARCSASWGAARPCVSPGLAHRAAGALLRDPEGE